MQRMGREKIVCGSEERSLVLLKNVVQLVQVEAVIAFSASWSTNSRLRLTLPFDFGLTTNVRGGCY